MPPLSDNPLVSVVVPCYNMAGYTRETIDSLLSQTYDPIEIIAVDDGSSDDTRAVLRSFGSRIRAVFQENAGACRARNRGYRESSGELVAFLDCDDLWEPEKAVKAVSALKDRSEAAMSYHHALWIDATGKTVGPARFPALPSGDIFRTLFVENFVRNSTPVIRRAAIEAVGAWDERIFVPADWEFWIRIAKRYPVIFIPEVLSRTRVASHYNARNIEQTRRESEYVFEKHGPDAGPEAVREAKSRFCFYLSRLHAANGDFRAAKKEVSRARRLNPLLKYAAMEGLYSLGGPVNAFAESLWRLCVRWGARVR